MEEKDNQISEQEQAPPLGSGAMLAAARKKQNKSIEEIADELNLSLTQIRTIELDQSEGLPEPTYVRGYIRSYASLLGLNPEEVLEHYLNKNWQKSANLDDMPRGIGDGDTAESSLFSPARVIVFLAIIGAAGFFWYSGMFTGLKQSQQADAVDNSEPVSGPVASESVSTQTQLPLITQDDAPIATEPSTTVENNQGEVSDQSDESAAVAVAEAPSSDTRVVLSFTETSWVDIRDEQQNRLAYQSYPAGETLDVAAPGVLSVLIGNAKGVEMILNGQPYDLRQHTEGVYAKFSVGQAIE